MPSIHVKELQTVCTSVPVAVGLTIKFKVITLSQPAAEPPTIVNVGVLVLAEYVMPSIHVKLLQTVCTSVPVTVGLTVKFSVTTLSQPTAEPPTIVNVGVVVLAEYVMPSIQVKELQAVCTSVPVAVGLTVKFKVTILSQPAKEPPTMVKVGMEVLACLLY